MVTPRQPRLLTLIPIAVLGLFPSVAKGQQALPTEKGQIHRPPAEVQPVTVSIDFPGGHVADYVAALRKQKAGINVVVDSEAREVSLPPISLQGASVANAVKMISLTARARERGLTVRALSGGGINAGNDVFVVSANRSVTSPLGPPAMAPSGREVAPAKRVQVFSLKQLIGGGPEGSRAPLKVGTVLEAIDLALGMQSSETSGKAVVKFNTPSGLLVVHGTSEQIDTVSQVHVELSKDAGFREGEIARAMIRRLEQELNDLKDQVGQLKQSGG